MKERIEYSFTLVEVVIACSILAVMLLGLGQTILVSQKQVSALCEDYDILSGCQKVMNEMLKLPFEEILRQDGVKFAIRIGSHGKQELSGRIKITEDLNGDGSIDENSPFYEGTGDAVSVLLYFRDRLILRRIVTKSGKVFKR